MTCLSGLGQPLKNEMQKAAIDVYRILILQVAKWIATATLFVSAVILILGLIDRLVPGMDWNYGWESIAFAVVILAVSAAIRRVVVGTLRRRQSESDQQQ